MAFSSPSYSKRNTVEKCLPRLSESVFIGLCNILGTAELVTMRRDVADFYEMIKNEANKKEFIMMISGSFKEGFRLLGSDRDFMYWPVNHQVIWDVSLFHEKCMQHLSESVFMGLCTIVGTSEQVTMRRDVLDMHELLNNLENINYISRMVSGSYREGFRLKISDVDMMYWSNHNRVIWDLGQSKFYEKYKLNLIVSDSSESPPGFTLLWLPFMNNLEKVCKVMKNRFYISSSKYKQSIQPSFKGFTEITSGMHGPCIASSAFAGVVDMDEAHCFASDFWPPSASSWIHRCTSWPGPHLVAEIVRKGCHFVAIGHSLGIHEDIEWRISFSLAETQLVYAMNHCQFLTYGLLKLFLKDVINNGVSSEEKLLCSYHMKTAVFWAIQQNKLLKWCPQNLLECFWVCFKLILKWVYEGVCPNFFIPENNMFLTKIHSDSQLILFLRLYTLYENGCVSCLLHYPFIRARVLNVLYNPGCSICTDEHTLISEVMFDELLFREINLIVLYSKKSNLRPVEMLETNVNKQKYIIDKISCNMLKLVAKFGCISDALYLAMYYYKTSRYTEALSIIEMTKVKLSQPYVIHLLQIGGRQKYMYSEAVGGKNWSIKMRDALGMHVILFDNICYFKEILIEQVDKRKRKSLIVPPFILIHMLELLCYRKVDTQKVQTALNDLRILVHFSLFENIFFSDISWQILGVCQYMTGDFKAAFYSYQQSLRQFPMQHLQTSTIIRIIILIYKVIHLQK
ncbi:uncharacterized protein LOC133174107 [Saccostrea echinata]|uniref:uncharacterized protein LOC133174107 n=1 Tax=Saccostrea echinata TaxID=191078 RepID=UPI002A8378ED|nr:uncharacterized protein LOC133174107 [Saccostrea echinata]